jgi:hypothetical protein
MLDMENGIQHEYIYQAVQASGVSLILRFKM